MPAIADRLRQYATAIADPTRGKIIMELDRTGELTATQLARRLGMNANNIYHHMRVLLELGVVDPPRIEPGQTYVEKYYRINPMIEAAVRLDPAWYDREQQTMTVEDRQAVIVSTCLTMSHLLREAAFTYGEMNAEALDQYARGEQLMMLAIGHLSRRHLVSQLAILRRAFEEEDREFAEDLSPRTDVMLVASLPFVGAQSADKTVSRANESRAASIDR